ncbi:hypothetical protein BJ122_102201 [Rhodopseudomonas faecalis]|uniref:CTP synthetase n=1 Tax=Rhodopseudomonas faecalis TaxID=99655 RepID=A0A318TT01_9BRAD|nr:hypothetical protein [Rhodopseudomonas faecalis]PYF04975.1 hypothetical protein BJ122_102201 [Rhodopseudomonas faecalis]
MLKIAILIWIIGGATLAGMCMVAVLVAANDQLIPAAVATGFVLAMPISVLVARKIAKPAA